ncbi:MAG: hypothetical protein AAFX93_11815 [Verrucomicrobiota bacterium]
MKRFLWQIAKFILLQAIILAASLLTFFGEPNKHHFLAGAIDKKARYESLEGPRIIVVGDSGAAFGIYSPILEERFPSHQPVNMALMAAVGLPTMLSEVEDGLREGDVVVLILAYQHFDRYIYSWEFFNYLAYRPDQMFSKPLREYKDLSSIGFYFVHRAIRSLPRYFTIGPHQPRNPPMHREGFNEYGDLVAHYEMDPAQGFSLTMDDLSLTELKHTDSIIKDLNRFAEVAESRGAEVFLLLPSISETTWEQNREVIEKIDDYVRTRLDFPVLNHPDEVIYPDDNFFDTFYHLTGPAAKRRTEHLAKRLEPIVDSKAK